MKRDRFKHWRDYLENILVAIFLALVVRTFIVSGYKVPSSSMAPTLVPGDYIFAYKLPFGVQIPLTSTKIGFQVPERGDVVVFTYPGQPHVNYVKRVIGLPGDNIQIENGEVILNGEKLTYTKLEDSEVFDFISADLFSVYEEKDSKTTREIVRLKESKAKSFGPIIVPPNEVFLLGDNRDSSDDSRYWGTVPSERIQARVLMVWLSLDWAQKAGNKYFPIVRWKRVGRSLN